MEYTAMNEELQSRKEWNRRDSSVNRRKKDSDRNYPDRTEIPSHAGRKHNSRRRRDRDRPAGQQQKELNSVAAGPVGEPKFDPNDHNHGHRHGRDIEAQG